MKRSKGRQWSCQKFGRSGLISRVERSLLHLKTEKSNHRGLGVGDCRCKRKGTNKLGSWGSLEDTPLLSLQIVGTLDKGVRMMGVNI